MKTKTGIIILGITILAGILLFISTSSYIDLSNHSRQPSTGLRQPILAELEGQALPSFKLLLPDSTTVVDVSRGLPNKPVVLFYFGPDCPYCQAEISEITREMDKLKNIQFYLFTVYPFDEMKKFYANFQLDKYPNIITGYDYELSFFEHFKIQSVPGIAIYGKDKRLKGTFVGNISYKQILSLSEK